MAGDGSRQRLPYEKIKCPDCAYVPRSRAKYEDHRNVHTGVKPHACPHCPYRSAQRTHVTDHVRLRHGSHEDQLQTQPQKKSQHQPQQHQHKQNKGKREKRVCLYKCRTTGCTFTSNILSHMKVHKYSEHAKRGPEAAGFAATVRKPKSFGCRFPGCYYRSGREDTVARHMENAHSGQQKAAKEKPLAVAPEDPIVKTEPVVMKEEAADGPVAQEIPKTSEKGVHEDVLLFPDFKGEAKDPDVEFGVTDAGVHYLEIRL